MKTGKELFIELAEANGYDPTDEEVAAAYAEQLNGEHSVYGCERENCQSCREYWLEEDADIATRGGC